VFLIKGCFKLIYTYFLLHLERSRGLRDSKVRSPVRDLGNISTIRVADDQTRLLKI